MSNALLERVGQLYVCEPVQGPEFLSNSPQPTDPLGTAIISLTGRNKPTCLWPDRCVDIVSIAEFSAKDFALQVQVASNLEKFFGQVRLQFLGELLNHLDAQKRSTESVDRQAFNRNFNGVIDVLLRKIVHCDGFTLGNETPAGALRHVTTGEADALLSPSFLERWKTSSVDNAWSTRRSRADTHLFFLGRGRPATSEPFGNKHASYFPAKDAINTTLYARHFARVMQREEAPPVGPEAHLPTLSVQERAFIWIAMSPSVPSSVTEASGSTHSFPSTSMQTTAQSAVPVPSSRQSHFIAPRPPSSISAPSKGKRNKITLFSTSRHQSPAASMTVPDPQPSSSPRIVPSIPPPSARVPSTTGPSPSIRSYSSVARTSSSTQQSGSTARPVRGITTVFFDTNVWVTMFRAAAPDLGPAVVESVLQGITRCGYCLLLSQQVLRELAGVDKVGRDAILQTLAPDGGRGVRPGVKILRELPVTTAIKYSASGVHPLQLRGDTLILAELAAAAAGQRAGEKDAPIHYRLYTGDKAMLLRLFAINFPPGVTRSVHFLHGENTIPARVEGWTTLLRQKVTASNLPQQR